MHSKKPQIQHDSIIKRDPEMLASKMDDEYVMMSVENGEYYGLDQVGSRIWELLEDEIRVSTLIDQLTAEYEVSREQCEQDVFSFLQDLAEKRLIHIQHA